MSVIKSVNEQSSELKCYIAERIKRYDKDEHEKQRKQQQHATIFFIYTYL